MPARVLSARDDPRVETNLNQIAAVQALLTGNPCQLHHVVIRIRVAEATLGAAIQILAIDERDDSLDRRFN
jgi:flagellar hook-basal body complex protein FliE